MLTKYPLTLSQNNIWVDQQVNYKSSVYNIGGQVNIYGAINYQVYNKAVNTLIKRNDSLRLSFLVNDKGNPYQIFNDFEDYDLPFIDFSLEKEPYNKADRWMKDEFKIPFDLNDNILFNFCFIKVSENHFIFFCKYHHIIIDGWSISLILEQIRNAYALIINKDEHVESREYSYKCFIEDDIKYLNSLKYIKSEEYWKKKFEFRPVSILSTPLFNTSISTHGNSLRKSIKIKSEDYSKLIKIAEIFNLTISNILLGILYIYLNKITSLSEIVIGIPLLNRGRKSFKKTVGLFAETSPLFINVDSNKNLKEFLMGIKLGLGECYRHQRYPVSRIEGFVRTNNIDRLCDVIFSFEQNSYDEKILDYNILGIPMPSSKQNNALTVHVMECREGEDVLVNFDYRPDIFQDFNIDNFTDQFQNLYRGIIDKPNSLLKDLKIIDPDEEKRILLKYSDTKKYYPEEKPIISQFEEQVAKSPNDVAIVFDDIKITYSELNEKANIVGHYLRDNYNSARNDLVGILMDRSDKMIISLLGILKSGAAYVPIDPTYPQDRINYIIEDSKPLFVIDDKNIDNILESQERIDNPLPVNDKKSILYVIYTSGTSGKPKGTVITNNNYNNYISWAKDYYFNDKTVGNFGLFTSLSFDLTTTSIFLSLLRGRTLTIFHPRRELYNVLEEIFNGTVIDSVKLTPSHLSILQGIDIKGSNINLVIAGGEELLTKHVKILININNNIKIVNEYGPTETTVGSIVKQIDDVNEKIVIGRPINNTKIYITDRHLNILPTGVPGEINIGGAGVGVGYLNRLELTEEKFIDNPFVLGEKLYRTGDIGRCLSSGDIEYLGRIDDQVKINGHRIELGEIEHSLLLFEDIQSAVVSVLDNDGQKSLSAYYISDRTIEHSEIRSFLGRLLPVYMIPSSFIEVDNIPLTPNGKVDKKSLPNPDFNFNPAKVSFTASKSINEKILSKIWKDVLGSKKDICVNDNFFELGGDSIKAIQIMSRLNQEGLKGEVLTLFDNPTIKEFALFIEDKSISIEQSKVSGTLPLSPIQNWFFKDLDCPKHHFNQAVMLELKEDMSDNNIGALKKSVEALLNHHDALRMSYTIQNDGIIQVNRSEVEICFRVFDLVQEVEPKLKIKDIINKTQSSFNLENDTLIRFILLKSKDCNQLLIVAHHLIIDGVSWRILLEDLQSGYRQAVEGKIISLPLKSTSFKVWSERLQFYSNSSELEKLGRFWNKNRMSKNILPDLQPKTILEKSVSSIKMSSEETNALLTKVNQVFKTGINDILLTSLIRALFRWCGENSFTIDLESHGRSDRFKDIDISRTIGWFTAIYPVLLNITDCDGIEEEIVTIKESLNEIPDNGISYGVLKYLSNDFEDIEESEILFNYLGQFDSDLDTDLFQLAFDPVNHSISPEANSSYKLNLNCMISGGVFSMTVDSQYYGKEILNEITKLYKEEIKQIIEYATDKVKLVDDIKISKNKTISNKPQRIRI